MKHNGVIGQKERPRMRNKLKPLSVSDIESHGDYKKAADFSDAFEPEKDKPYGWLYEHAMHLLRDANQSVAALDVKAENMVRYVGPGSGLMSIAVAWLASGEFFIGSELARYVIIAGLTLFMFATISALLSLLPHHKAIAPPVDDVLGAIEKYDSKDEAMAKAATGIEISVEVMIIVAEEKAGYLLASYWAFFLGFALLAISIVVVILRA